KSSPTTPTSFTGPKKLAATAAWLAEPPSSRGFSAFGVLIESNAVEPTTNTLIKWTTAFVSRAAQAKKFRAPSQCEKEVGAARCAVRFMRASQRDVPTLANLRFAS